MRSLRILTMITAVVAFGCSRSTGPKLTVHALADTPEDRVGVMVKMIERHAPLPGPIRSVEALEEQIGDGGLGPSDFRFFAKIVVQKEDVASWKSAAGPELSSGTYEAPQSAPLWWLAEGDFDGVTLHSPKTLFGRSNGWIGFSPDEQTIYVMTFTM